MSMFVIRLIDYIMSRGLTVVFQVCFIDVVWDFGFYDVQLENTKSNTLRHHAEVTSAVIHVAL